MAQTQSLFPISAKWIAISVTQTASTPVLLPAIGNTIYLASEGNKCFVCVASEETKATVPTGTAAATCTPVLGGVEKTHGIPAVAQYISAICATGQTATLWVAVSEGC